MIPYRRVGVVFLGSALAAACGGTSFTGTLGGGMDAGSDGSLGGSSGSSGGSSGGGSGTSGSSGSSSSSGSAGSSGGSSGGASSDGGPGNGEAAADDGPASNDVVSPPMDAPGAPCPDVSGAYSIAILQGAGCGDLSAIARQCIQQDALGCAITFVSQGSSNTAAINGDPTLQADGSFDGAALTEGSVDRTGCTGSWDTLTSTMTVDCGGTGSSQSCVVALTRVNARCM
jgi:hypothetical protein